MRHWRSGVAGALAALVAVFITACRPDVTQAVKQDTQVTVLQNGSEVTGVPVLRSSASCSEAQRTLWLRANVPGTWASSDTTKVRISDIIAEAVTNASGSVILTFTPSDGSMPHRVPVIVDPTSCGTPTGPSVGTLSFTPHGGNYQVGSTIPLTITCSNVSCTNVQILSSDAAVITADLVAKSIKCLAAGSARIIVQASSASLSPADTANFTCQAVVTPTISLNQVGPITLRTGQNCPAAVLTVSTVGGVLANWTSSNTGLLPFQGANNSVSQVTLQGVAGQSGTSIVTANGLNGGSASIQVNLDATACSQQNGTFTVSPSSLNLTNCTGMIQNYTITPMGPNGQALSGASWTFTTTSSGGSIGSASTNGFNLNGTAGTGNAVVSVPGYTSVTIPVTVTQCSSGPTPTVSVNPKTLTLTLGGGSGTLTAVVQNATANGTWTTPDNKGCVSLSSNGTVATVSPVKMCSEIVRYTITVNGTQYSDQALVTVNAGATSCSWSTANNQYDFLVSQTFNGTASCVYQGVVQQPYWYSKDPSRVTVQGAPYVCMIGGVAYPCGNSATMKAIYQGSTDVCVQAAVQDNSVYGCHTIRVTAASGDLIPNDGPKFYEFPLMGKPKAGSKIDAVYTWDQWKAYRMLHPAK